MQTNQNLPGIDPKILAIITIVFIVLGIWSIIWKGISLWKAAKNGSKTWFIFLLITNTLGILDILYIYIFSKKNISNKKNN